MWLKFWLSFFITIIAFSADPNEAKILKERGYSYLKQGKFEEAALDLQRLIDLFPAEAGQTITLQKLGEAYLKSNQLAKSTEVLSSLIALDNKSIASLTTRLLLGESFIKQKKFSEAALTAQEILKRKPNPPTPETIQVNALLLQSEAQFGLAQFDEAKLSVQKAFEKIEKTSKPKPEMISKRLRIELALCDRLASQKGLTEEQLLDQLERRGLCLFDASVHAKTNLNQKETWNTIREAYSRYADICRNPPEPEGKRNEAQLEAFKKEFAQKSVPECAERITQMAKTLKKLQKEDLEKLK